MSSWSGNNSSAGASLIGDIMPFYVNGYQVSANQGLTGAASVNGGTANNGEVILLGAQTNPAENGLWVVNTSGAWSRYSLYTGDAALKSPIICVSPTTSVKYVTFRYNGLISPVVIGITALSYCIDWYEGPTSSVNIRALAAAGDAIINFMANGGGTPASTVANITRNSGANGNLVITNVGSGLLNLVSGGQISITSASAFACTVQGGSVATLNLGTNITSGSIVIGASGSTENTAARQTLHGPTSATAGIATPANRITTGSASSPTARQLQMFFDPAGAAIASYTVTLPASTALIDGQELLVHSGAFGVTSLTLTAGAGTSIRGAITTLAADSFARYKYIAAITAWVRIG
jgi:hypothetical protein